MKLEKFMLAIVDGVKEKVLSLALFILTIRSSLYYGLMIDC